MKSWWGDLAVCLELVDPHALRHGADDALVTRRLTKESDTLRRLDYFLISRDLQDEQLVVGAGVLEDLPLNNSDHKLVYIVIKASIVLGILESTAITLILDMPQRAMAT